MSDAQAAGPTAAPAVEPSLHRVMGPWLLLLFIVGDILGTGIYALTGKTSLLQAVALAGGLDDLADPRAVVVFRNVDGKRMGAAFDLVAVRRGEMPDPQVYGDDIIVVERSGSRTAVREFMDKLGVFAMFLAL